ncbi:unnamed protein product, partial [Ectocarpus fasciculatus]
MLNPLASNKTVLNHLMGFADHTQYLFFATVCRGWSRTWGERPAVTRAVSNGTSVSQLSYSFGCGLPRTKGICETATRLGRLDLLQCAVLNDCPFGTMVCAEAALRGHLGIIWWARTYGSEWDENTCSAAASGRHLKILQYCREHGCPWDSGTAASAARCGSLSVLKWAKENGCEWDEDTCTSAAFGGHLEILMWCREQGCGWNEETAAVAAARGHEDVFQFCIENGCPWDPDNIEKETAQETDGVAEGCQPHDPETGPTGSQPILQDLSTAQSSSPEMHGKMLDELDREAHLRGIVSVIWGNDPPLSDIEDSLLGFDPLFSDDD